jgi:uncharacterized membrane protein YdjX (TVP38/TMEM64 family)
MQAGLVASADSRIPPASAPAFSGRSCALACGLVVVLVVAALLFPLRAGVAELASWARGAGFPGVLAFAVAHVLCALLLIPSWPLRVSAGFVYGAVGGLALALSSSLVGATLAFLAARVVLRERIARRIAREPRLVALDEAIAGNGLWTVFLLRLSPLLPNELVNYGLGATRVGFRDYALASLVGMLPLTASYAWVGSLLTAVSDLTAGRPAVTGILGQLIWWGGLGTTILLAIGSTYLARGALDRTLVAKAGRRDLAAASKDGARVLVSDG